MDQSASLDDRSSRGIYPSIALVFVLVLLAHLPLLRFRALTSDPDGWRLITAAKMMSLTHEYEASRVPCFPIPEIAAALVVQVNPRLTNYFVFVLGIIGPVLFYLILRKLEVRQSVLAALALSSVPIIYINSFSCMDYIWSLTFMLAALTLILYERPTWAGLFFGLAIGSRITMVVVFPALALILIDQVLRRQSELPNHRLWIRRLTFFCVGTGITTLICRILPLMKYGLASFGHNDGTRMLKATIEDISLGVYGTLGALVLLGSMGVFLVNEIRQGRIDQIGHWLACRRRNDSRRDLLRLACLSGFAAEMILYLIYPYEAAYLIPSLPFVLILLADFLPSKCFTVVLVGIIISPFVGYGPKVFAAPYQAEVEVRDRLSAEDARYAPKIEELAATAQSPIVIQLPRHDGESILASLSLEAFSKIVANEIVVDVMLRNAQWPDEGRQPRVIIQREPAISVLKKYQKEGYHLYYIDADGAFDRYLKQDGSTPKDLGADPL